MSNQVARPSISSVVIRAVLTSAECLGVDSARLARELELRADALEDPRARVDFATDEALWRALAEQLGPHAGLRLGSCLTRGALGMIEYAMRASEDVESALTTLAGRSSFLHATKLFELSRHTRGATLVYISPHAEDWTVTKTSSEFVLAALVTLLRDATTEDVALGVLRLRGGKRSLARGLLGPAVVDVDVDASAYALDLTTGAIRLRMRDADPELQRLLLHWLSERCRLVPPIEDVVTRASRVLRQRMGHGGVGLNVVARALGMSTRALQLRLAERGLSYRELSRHIRAKEAANLLRDPDRTLPDIAERVGFGDVRSLHRAFKREYGTTPAVFRRRLMRSEGGATPSSAR